MSKLANIQAVWNSPEAAFRKMYEKGKIKDRFDFLKVALNYSPNYANAFRIRSLLSDEMMSYTEQEQEECTQLLQLLDKLHEYVGQHMDDHPSIDDLDLLCNKIKLEYEEFVEKSSDALDFGDYDLMINDTYCSAEDAVNAGFFINAIFGDESSGAVGCKRIDPLDPNYKCFNNEESAVTFLQNHIFGSDEFLDKVYTICMFLILSNERISYPLVFVSPALYEYDGKMLKYGDHHKMTCSKSAVTYAVTPLKIDGEVKEVHASFITKLVKGSGDLKVLFVQ